MSNNLNGCQTAPATAPIPAAIHPEKMNFRRQEASRYIEKKYGIPCAVATLAKLASVGGGPRFFKASRVPLYPRESLDLWAVSRMGPLVGSTSELKVRK